MPSDVGIRLHSNLPLRYSKVPWQQIEKRIVRVSVEPKPVLDKVVVRRTSRSNESTVGDLHKRADELGLKDDVCHLMLDVTVIRYRCLGVSMVQGTRTLMYKSSDQ